MVYDESLMLVKAAFKKGGVFAVKIGDEIKAGDSFIILPNVTLGATALETGILIDVFSPMREDFV